MKRNEYVIFYNYQGQSWFIVDFAQYNFLIDTTVNPDFADRFKRLSRAKYWRDKLNEWFPEFDFNIVRLKSIGVPEGYTVNLGNAMFAREVGDVSFNLTMSPMFARRYKRTEAEIVKHGLALRYNEPSFRVRPYWLVTRPVIY